MDFNIGYKVKPKEIDNFNVVIFEEYTDKGVLSDVLPTEDDCREYNFSWINNKCFVLSKNTDFIKDYDIFTSGKRSDIGNYCDNSLIVGIDNKLDINNYNDLIVGDSNTITDGINCTILSGTKGEANYNNSQVLAGNQIDDLENRQSIIVLAGEETTSSAWSKARLNNDGSSVFNIKDNSIITFNFYITAVRTGGTAAGSKGDFKSWVERGTAVNRAGTTTLKRVRQNIGNDGTTTGWNTLSAVNATNDLNISIKGATNMNIKWIVKLELIEMRTGVDLS